MNHEHAALRDRARSRSDDGVIGTWLGRRAESCERAQAAAAGGVLARRRHVRETGREATTSGVRCRLCRRGRRRRLLARAAGDSDRRNGGNGDGCQTSRHQSIGVWVRLQTRPQRTPPQHRGSPAVSSRAATAFALQGGLFAYADRPTYGTHQPRLPAAAIESIFPIRLEP